MNSIAENLSDKIAFRLCESKDKSSDEFEVLKYGVFAFIHMLMAVIFTIIFGMLTDTLFPIVTISLTVGIMKRNSGGVHCSSPNRCLVTGIIISYIFSLIYENLVSLNVETLYLLSGIILIHSFIIIYKKCPVPSKNKPLKKNLQEKN